MEVKLIKIPAWLSELTAAITSALGIEPSRLVQSVIISVLVVVVIAAVAGVIFVLRSWLSRDQQIGGDNANVHAISAATRPSVEYERMINDAIETALLPVFRRIKRLEEQSTPEAAPPRSATPSPAAAQLYDDVQDVVLPQEESAEPTTVTPIQDASLPKVPPQEESAEHTTVSQIQDASLPRVPLLEENAEHTTVSQIQDSKRQD